MATSPETLHEIYDAVQSVMTDPKHTETYHIYGIGPSDLIKEHGFDYSLSTISRGMKELQECNYLTRMAKSTHRAKYILTSSEFLPFEKEPIRLLKDTPPTTIEEYKEDFLEKLNTAITGMSAVQEAFSKLTPILLDLYKDHETYVKVKTLLFQAKGTMKI